MDRRDQVIPTYPDDTIALDEIGILLGPLRRPPHHHSSRGELWRLHCAHQ